MPSPKLQFVGLIINILTNLGLTVDEYGKCGLFRPTPAPRSWLVENQRSQPAQHPFSYLHILTYVQFYFLFKCYVHVRFHIFLWRGVVAGGILFEFLALLFNTCQNTRSKRHTMNKGVAINCSQRYSIRGDDKIMLDEIMIWFCLSTLTP